MCHWGGGRLIGEGEEEPSGNIEGELAPLLVMTPAELLKRREGPGPAVGTDASCHISHLSFLPFLPLSLHPPSPCRLNGSRLFYPHLDLSSLCTLDHMYIVLVIFLLTAHCFPGLIVIIAGCLAHG